MRYRRNNKHSKANIYHEEIAAEMIRSPYRRHEGRRENNQEKVNLSKLLGFVALFLSVLSFFVAPFACGVIAIALGFIAQRKGEISIGAWAIGISALSMILAIFVIPHF